MNRIPLYVATAIILGLVAMLTPLKVLTDLGYVTKTDSYQAALEYTKELDIFRQSYVETYSPNFLNLGLVVVVSFVFAFGASFLFKKRFS